MTPPITAAAVKACITDNDLCAAMAQLEREAGELLASLHLIARWDPNRATCELARVTIRNWERYAKLDNHAMRD